MSGKIRNFYTVGQRFGWLTVLGEGTKSPSGARRIRVQCRCGRIYDSSPEAFKRDDCKCHWCANKIKAQMRTLDLVGKTYGNYEVLEKAEQNDKGMNQYRCRCKRRGSISLRTQYEITHYSSSGKCSKCKPEFYFDIKGDTAIGTLPSGDKFTIDAEDIPLVSKYWWYKKADSDYVIADIKAKGKLIKRLRLHRLLLGVEDDIFVVDHINRNPLDCRKSNLRVATQHQNCINKGIRSSNTTGYIGVKKLGKGMFEAQITVNGQPISLGKSHNIVTCAQMYNIGAQYLFRQFAGQLNCVSAPPEWIEFQVWKKCRPYENIANQITAPVICV